MLSPLLCALLLLACVWNASAIDCYKKTADTMAVIYATNKTNASPDPKCGTQGGDDRCHVVFQKAGRENLTFGCGKCESSQAASKNFDNSKQDCEDCGAAGCSTDFRAVTKWKAAFDKYKPCIFMDSAKPFDFSNAPDILCAENEKCQRFEYVNSSSLKVFVGCASDCAAAVSSKKTADGKNATCADCSVDDNDQKKADYCKKVPVDATTTTPASKTNPAGADKSPKSDKSSANRAAPPAAALLVVASVLLRAAVLP